MSSEKAAEQSKKRFRLSLRYKVAVPVLIFVTLMLFMLFQTTFRFVRELVIERNERRLYSIAEVFTESLKVPLVLGNQQVLEATLDWMASRNDVVEVRVEDDAGTVRGSTSPELYDLPAISDWESFAGVRRIGPGRYVTVVPIEVADQKLGRLIIIFTQQDLEEELRQIFLDRMLMAFTLGAFLALMTAGVTWVLLRPLYKLKKVVQQILAGNMEARAQINSFDEIEDLGDAFNEMVSRLARSLDNLRARSHALEESEEKYRLIVDNASDIIFALTLDGELVFLNEGFSGLSREELMDGGIKLFKELHTDDTLERFQEALAAVINTRDTVINIATTHVHRELNAEVYYLTNFTPLVDMAGNVKLIQGVMRDVTELRRIEIMKESLIRDVAHELKTPTAKFEMAVNVLERELQSKPELQQYASLVKMLKDNTNRLMRTIMSIMDLSKLESGMLEIDRKELDLCALLQEVSKDMEPLCQQSGLNLAQQIPDEPCMIEGDHDMLYRLFVNLITNAIKYSEKGTITVKLGSEKKRPLVEVLDEGIGIEDKFLKTIFDRFVQKTASSVGIGVGLTICRDIAILHHAKIWAESDGLGKGSVFKVKF